MFLQAQGLRGRVAAYIATLRKRSVMSAKCLLAGCLAPLFQATSSCLMLFDAFEGSIQVLGKTNGRDNGKLLSEALTASSLHSSKSWLRFVLACATSSSYLQSTRGARVSCATVIDRNVFDILGAINCKSWSAACLIGFLHGGRRAGF